jgi:hypothetical protein
MNRHRHWNQVYEMKGPLGVNWYQRHPEVSLALITVAGAKKDARLIGVGGVASMRVDCLLDAGYTGIAVLDSSGIALTHSCAHLGARAPEVEWFEADVMTFKPPHRFGLWHDRAVFHFLTEIDERRGYVATLR